MDFYLREAPPNLNVIFYALLLPVLHNKLLEQSEALIGPAKTFFDLFYLLFPFGSFSLKRFNLLRGRTTSC